MHIVKKAHKLIAYSFIAALVLTMVFVLGGCSSNDTSNSDETNGSEEVTEQPMPEEESEQTANKEESSDQEAEKEEATDESVVILDNDVATFTVLNKTDDSMFGVGYDVEIINNSDADILISMDKVSIDGKMCDPFWAETIAAGKRSEDSIIFMDGVESTDDLVNVEGNIRIANDETYETIGEYPFVLE